MSSTGNRIAALRKQRDWNRTVVAAACNVGEKTVYRWETGESQLPSSLIPPLAALFDVTPEYLMGWDRDSESQGAAAA